MNQGQDNIGIQLHGYNSHTLAMELVSSSESRNNALQQEVNTLRSNLFGLRRYYQHHQQQQHPRAQIHPQHSDRNTVRITPAINKIMTELYVIDAAIGDYYGSFGITDYFDDDGNGKFVRYILDEEIYGEDLPIKDFLGDDAKPCEYTDFDDEFPIPDTVNIANDDEKDVFILSVVKYCYRHHESP
eukprot:31354_1